MNKQTIALAGGSGHLGSLIARALLAKPEVRLRLLVRPGSGGKVAGLVAQGAEVVEGEIGRNDTAALSRWAGGAASIISAIQGGPDLIVEGQTELLRVARQSGVRRFIPSDFSLDMFTVAPGRIVTSDWRRRFADLAQAERGPVEVVHVLNGGFLDRGVLFGFINVVNPQTQTAYVWGDGKQTMHWTTYGDTARYTAEAAADERPVPRRFAIAGDALDFWGIVAAYEAGSGKKLKIQTLGSLDELDARITELVKGGQQNFGAFLPLMYYRAMLRGEGRLDPLMNHRYPAIQPTGVRAYVERERL
ncbi:MAG: NmrA family NAD(P)-binding protein [Burkholderiaceae bacterium]|jgi:nucleoside-diphosphate-sugar epimerase|nr:NmrA family NAD(P)-binding protein [Burkholderiaceae bacterium]